MKPTSRAAAAALLALALAWPCAAGQVKLEIRDGLVTLSAKDASVREVLGEWARVGQTRIVNAERVPSGLITLELNRVPEAKALDILLRSVAGYMAAARPAANAGASQYDRILIMPVARAAAGVAAPPPAAATTQQQRPYPDPRMRTYQPQPSLMVDDQDEPVQPQPQPQPQPQIGTPPSYPGASQPGVMTPGTAPAPGQYTYPQTGQQPGQQPGMVQPQPQPQPQPGGQSPAAPRPGMTTPPPRPPGNPGGNE